MEHSWKYFFKPSWWSPVVISLRADEYRSFDLEMVIWKAKECCSEQKKMLQNIHFITVWAEIFVSHEKKT